MAQNEEQEVDLKMKCIQFVDQVVAALPDVDQKSLGLSITKLM